ncbi:hypothetical protein B0T17DRAFT_535289 [Bombardia bombarda]|uniref:Uncharacterized protein n=1 Tax=Bombardia bombarda TaxID=252184 RepID=A0AA39WUN1_9PEZI|nr:hypothetical protein B0T17DRAFT_535289 [Bombardia bombarda]
MAGMEYYTSIAAAQLDHGQYHTDPSRWGPHLYNKYKIPQLRWVYEENVCVYTKQQDPEAIKIRWFTSGVSDETTREMLVHQLRHVAPRDENRKSYDAKRYSRPVDGKQLERRLQWLHDAEERGKPKLPVCMARMYPWARQ